MDNLSAQSEQKTLTSNDEFAKVRETGYQVEIGTLLSEGWNLVQQNLGSLIGFGIVSFFIIIIAAILLSFIPIVGNLINNVLIGVLIAGFYTFFIKYYIDGFAAFSDFFESFQDAVQIGLASLISSLLSSIPAVIIIVIVAIIAVSLGASGAVDFAEIKNGNFDSIGGVLFFVGFIVILLITIPTLIISMFYILAPLLIITHKIDFWPAMELSRKLIMKNLWGNFGLFFVLGIINLLGAIPLGLGLLITIPLTYASIFTLYVNLLEKNGENTDFGSNFYGDENAPLDAF